MTSIKPSNKGYTVRTDQADLKATNMVIATELFQHSRIPWFSFNMSTEICQLHSSEYRKPNVLLDNARV